MPNSITSASGAWWTRGSDRKPNSIRRKSRYKAQQAAYDATVNQARNLLQDIERNKASLELQRKKLRDTTVYAPFAAAVKERQVTLGQYVRPNTPLFTLVKTDPIRLRLEVPERMAPWIKNGANRGSHHGGVRGP